MDDPARLAVYARLAEGRLAVEGSDAITRRRLLMLGYQLAKSSDS